uniref:Uncharacterized protein n=1 Tax=Oryza brachyantha TaxID=4533 RepID=J3LM58_ORYBR
MTSKTKVILLDWVLENWNRGQILDVVDSRLSGEYVVKEANLVLKLGLSSQQLPSARPSMRQVTQVLQYLDGTVQAPDMPCWKHPLATTAGPGSDL